jgi:hypothetical protein
MVEFACNKNSYIILRGLCFHTVFLKVHAPTQDKTDDTKNSVYEELEREFDNFLTCHMVILLEFNAKVDREGIFKPTIMKENLH